MNAKKANRGKAKSGVSDGQSIFLMFYSGISTIHTLVLPSFIKEIFDWFTYLWKFCANALLVCVLAILVASHRHEKPQDKKEEVRQAGRQYPQETKKVGAGI